MPGYSQLKKLSEQLLKLGNEINVRAKRGEKAFPYPVPDSIPDIDDSEDFINGMPEKPKTPEEIAAEEAAAKAEEEARLAAERAASGIDDIFGSSGFDSLDSFEEKKKKGVPSAKSFLEEEEEEEEAPPPPKGINGTGYSGFGFDDDGNLEEPSLEPSPDIAAMMGGPGRASISSGSPDSTGFSELDALIGNAVDETPVEKKAPAAESSSSDPFGLDSLGDFGDFDLSSFESTPSKEVQAANAASDFDLDLPEAVSSGSKQGAEAVAETETEPAADTGLDFDLPDFPAEETSAEPEPTVEEPVAEEPAAQTEAVAETEPAADTGLDFDLPDFPEEPASDSASETVQTEAEAVADAISGIDFDLPDFPETETDTTADTEVVTEEPAADTGLDFDLPDFPAEEPAADTATDSTGGMDFDLPDFPAEESATDTTTDATAGVDFDLPDFPAEETSAEPEPTVAEEPLAQTEEPAADTGMDFDLPDFPAEESATDTTTDATAGVDFDLPDFPAEETSAEPEPTVEEPVVAETPVEESAPVDDGIDLSDLGIDGLEIEDYKPTAAPAAKASATDDIDVDSLFSGGKKAPAPKQEENFEVTEFKEDPKKKAAIDLKGVAKAKAATKGAYQPKSIDEDIAILKPDIFTENPVTRDNPPFYVTGEYGKLPKTPEEEAEEAAAAEAAAAGVTPQDEDDGPSNFANIDFDAVENEPEETRAPAAAPAEPAAPAADNIKVEEYSAPAETPAAGGDDMFNTDMFNMDDMGTMGAAETPSDNPLDGATEFSPTASGGDDMFSTDFDAFSMDGGTDTGATDIDTSGGMPDFGDLGDTTDFSVGDGSFADFNIPETDAKLDAAKGDFELDGDFNIPGFSEADADPYAVKKGRSGGLDQVDFSGAMPGVEKQRTSLTEEEYKKFKKNLNDYPLNVRIVVEDMIYKNEFTDEVIFELIDKILSKVTARQLAGYLEKMLDITLHVPRDFEKRTAAEYEAYKASLGYQLKSRIIPAVLIGLLSAMILFCIGYLGFRYIVNPLWAEKLYKEGYTLLERDDYPQSEMKFDEALTHKPKKKWFYKYAQGYRDHRQYDRAEKFYKAILKRFDHDKPAGLEYARMMLEDLGDYERAEEILKREVLDYHVNDAEGMLALGDTYLDWATEKDPAKFKDAFDQYSVCSQLFGSKNPDLYQSRFLRYNIRTDQLHSVLELKEFFYPREKSLSAEDWTEMSGYLMEKLYGELPRSEEYLRGKIEDLRDMLLFAIKAKPENPISNYNLSRYFVEVGDHTKALQSLKTTKTLFDQAPNLKPREIYKQIDNYRLLGEEYLYDREYILAREEFTEGLNLFEKKQRFNKFEGDKNVGLMYSDMGNLEYFISGDLDSAKRNYKNAIDNKVDTPSIRYRVGYIDYSNNDYTGALGNFLKASEQGSTDSHTLLALGNTLSLKNDNYTAQSYYERLLSYLDFQRDKYGITIPQIDPSAGDMVEVYMKAANNLGVSQFRVSRQSGNSSLNAKSLVNFQNSIRYYDALTRNQETMVRLPGSNLAEQNLKYATNPISTFEPAIYTEIPRVLDGEKGLEQ